MIRSNAKSSWWCKKNKRRRERLKTPLARNDCCGMRSIRSKAVLHHSTHRGASADCICSASFWPGQMFKDTAQGVGWVYHKASNGLQKGDRDREEQQSEKSAERKNRSWIFEIKYAYSWCFPEKTSKKCPSTKSQSKAALNSARRRLPDKRQTKPMRTGRSRASCAKQKEVAWNFGDKPRARTRHPKPAGRQDERHYRRQEKGKTTEADTAFQPRRRH